MNNDQTTNLSYGTGGNSSDDVFAMLGLQDLPEEEKKTLLEKLEKVIQEQVIHLIVTQLDDDQCKDLNEKMDQGMDQVAIIEYIREKIPNLEDQIRQLIEDFREDLLKEVADIRQEIAAGKKPSSKPVTDRFKKGFIPPKNSPQGKKLHGPTPEVLEYLQQLDQLIAQATEQKDYDQLMELMQRRKALKEEWGILE